MPITYDNAAQGFGNLASALLLAPQMAKRNRMEEEAARLHQQQMNNQTDFQNRSLAQALRIHEDTLKAQSKANDQHYGALNEHYQREDSHKALSDLGSGAMHFGKVLASALGGGPRKGVLTDNERYNLAIAAARHKAGVDDHGKPNAINNADVDHYMQRIRDGLSLEEDAPKQNAPVYPAGVPKTADAGYLWNSNVPSAKDWNASNEPQEYHPRMPDGSPALSAAMIKPQTLAGAMNAPPDDDAETVSEIGPGDESEVKAPAAVPAVDPLEAQVLADPGYQKKYGTRLKDPATMGKIVSALKAAGH